MSMISHPMGALPVRTLERVPAETVQVWVQFACSANNPGVFFVLADVFFALSWEVRAHDSWQHVEYIIQHGLASPHYTMDSFVQDTEYAADDWRGAVERLTGVMNQQGSPDYSAWRDFAADRAEQMAQASEQTFQYILVYCEQNGLKLPAHAEQRLARQLEAQMVYIPGQ